MRLFKKLAGGISLLGGVAAAGAITLPPSKPPPSMYVSTGTVIKMAWTPTVTYADGAPIPASVLANASYKLYTMNPTQPGVVTGFVGYVSTNVYQAKMTVAGNSCYAVTRVVYNPNATESAKSVTMCWVVVPSVCPCGPKAASTKEPAEPSAPRAPLPVGAEYHEGGPSLKAMESSPPPK